MLMYLKVCKSHISQAQGQLPAKTGVNETTTEKNTFSSQR
jgi:hypothetical protein